MEMEKLFQYKTLQRDNYEILFKSLRRMEIERIWRDDPIFWECRVLHAALSTIPRGLRCEIVFTEQRNIYLGEERTR